MAFVDSGNVSMTPPCLWAPTMRISVGLRTMASAGRISAALRSSNSRLTPTQPTSSSKDRAK